MQPTWRFNAKNYAMMSVRSSLCIACLSLLIAACGSLGPRNWEDGDPTTIILVRHAEAGSGNDPDLTVEGRARAQRLAVMLQRVDLDAIYINDTRRARQTAEPTAENKRVRTQRYESDELDNLLRDIQRSNRGETVLVVGQSDTTPALFGRLVRGVSAEPIPGSEYDNMYIVSNAGTERARLLILKY